MDWFERLTGFREAGYDDTRSRLEIDGQGLRSRINGRSYGIGQLELVAVKALRDRASSSDGAAGRLVVRNISGDVRRLHRRDEFAGALFQVASQFNLLEMISPECTPEDGVTIYQFDPTQGPGCAIAAGAATIYRNYFAPIGDVYGQRADRQLDGLAAVGVALGRALGRPVGTLWRMHNGYAMCSSEGLAAIGEYLDAIDAAESERLRQLLRVGVQWDVQVTDAGASDGQFVSQVFCSALPVAYSRVPPAQWARFAKLVLEAAYEATLWAAVLNARRGASNIVLLTRLGGGAFGNGAAWIDAAMARALAKVKDFNLDVRLVSFGNPPPSMLALEAEFR